MPLTGRGRPNNVRPMKKIIFAFTAVLVLAAAAGFAAQPKTYQATGPITAITDDTITIDKGADGKWEIAKGDQKTDAKVGDKVTITYRMTASKIEVKTR
jgi:uncharacterized protein YxeA